MDDSDLVVEVVEESEGGGKEVEKDIIEVVMEWQTCDDDCSGNRYYRLVIRPQVSGFGDDWPEIVRQKEIDGEWVDDRIVGEPGIDGTYSLGSS